MLERFNAGCEWRPLKRRIKMNFETVKMTLEISGRTYIKYISVPTKINDFIEWLVCKYLYRLPFVKIM